MASKKVEDYLTKQIFIEKSVVTFRSLSRQFNIHVNRAKRELATFYEKTRSSSERSYATYLISGEAFSKASNVPDVTSTQSSSMDVDGTPSQGVQMNNSEADDGEVVPELRITLVTEQELEAARGLYSRITSEHVYSLSPSPVLDIGLLCSPSDVVYTKDAKMKLDESVLLGRITGPHVEVGKPSKPAPARARESVTDKESPLSRKTKGLGHEQQPVGETEEIKKDRSTPPKPKPSGKLDWSKAKTKANPDKDDGNEVVVKVEQDERIPEKTKPKGSTMKDFFAKKEKASSNKDGEHGAVKGTAQSRTQASTVLEQTKHGLKRKSPTPTESEAGPAPRERTATPSSDEQLVRPQTRSKADYRIRGNAILSDDEDEDEKPVPIRKGKGKAKLQVDIDLDDIPTKSEMSLRAMMDIDDDQVEKIARTRSSRIEHPATSPEPSSPEETEAEPFTDDAPAEDSMDLDEDDIPIGKPKRKRKEKKVIPVGRNGLKKKRVVKSRTTMDSKGYMATEDYSEYESVDEEEVQVEEAQPARVTKPTQAKDKPKIKTEEKDIVTAASSQKDTAKPRKVIKPSPPKRTGSIGGSKVTHKGSIMKFFGKT